MLLTSDQLGESDLGCGRIAESGKRRVNFNADAPSGCDRLRLSGPSEEGGSFHKGRSNIP